MAVPLRDETPQEQRRHDDALRLYAEAVATARTARTTAEQGGR